MPSEPSYSSVISTLIDANDINMTNWQDFPKYALPPFTILDGGLELESDRLL